MKKNLPLLPAMAGLLLLTGCGAPVGLAAWTAGVAYETKPDDLPPADTDSQMPPHESWCYKTMGEVVECYTEPQDTPPGRLLNVDPPNKFPLTAKAYDAAVAKSKEVPKPAEAAAPVAADPALYPPDQNGMYNNDGASMPPAVTPAEMLPIQIVPQVKSAIQPPPKPKAVKHKKARSKKKQVTTYSAKPPAAIPNNPK